MPRNTSANPRKAPKPKFHERDITEIANQEDSSDDDFNIGEFRSSSKSRKKPSKKSKSKKSKRSQRRRRHGSYSSGDIVDDSESGSDDVSSLGTGRSYDDDSDVEINPKTGRAMRTTSKRAANYAESSESDSASGSDRTSGSEEDLVEDVEDDEAVKLDESDSLVVTLRLPSEFLRNLDDSNMPRQPKQETRSRTGSAAPLASGLRRSARISQSPEPRLLALGAKGRVQRMAKDGALLSVLSEKSFETDGARPHPNLVQNDGEEEDEEEGRDFHDDVVDEENVATPSQVGHEDPSAASHIADAGTQPEDLGERQGDRGSPMESIEIHHKAFFDEDEDGAEDDSDEALPVKRSRHGKHKSRGSRQPKTSRKKSDSEDDDYNPESEEELPIKKRSKSKASNHGKAKSDFEDDSFEDEVDEVDEYEMQDEIHELTEGKRRRTAKIARDLSPLQARKRLEPGAYGTITIDEEQLELAVDEEKALKNPRKSAAGFSRPKNVHSAALFSMGGIFGGAPKANNNSDSDSSDDEAGKIAAPTRMDIPPPTPHGANTGKSKHGGADITPLKVTGCDFSSVGGHENTLSSLNETMILPILYQQEFKEVDMKPPAGVLFTGPPGTGKTLLARAVAGELEKRGIKATFYMRKGGDVMSKYVGEAERSLRMLFETAKKTAPSIIFFDEFDGLAPVRSSKNDQAHASIVATLLALMDGVESRGQIMIIGATNRPDQIDPAFRRPGRFDREVRLTLPTEDARRQILNVHTKHWKHQPSEELKDMIAKETAGYAGADLAVLCNEANVISLKRKYPQIWLTDKKLKVDMKNLTVVAADFQLAMRKITPASRRETSLQQTALPDRIEPLLRTQFDQLTERVEKTMPTHKRKKLTDLEEILHAHPDPEVEHRREERRRGFETGRVYRPRLLLTSSPGNGLDYTANALVHHLENHYTRAIDFNSLSGDSSLSLAASLGLVLKEVRRNQPSILYIPSVDEWYQSMPPDVVHILVRFLRSLPASDQIMVLGTLDADISELDLPVQSWIKMTFGVTDKNRFILATPDSDARFKYMQGLIEMIKNRPTELTEKRKRRKLEQLPEAPILPAEAPKLTKAELKAQREQDEITLSLLRSHLRVILNQVLGPYATLKTSVIDDRKIEYLLQETDPNFVVPDLTLEQQPANMRPYEVTTDKHGNRMLLETETGDKYYNCNLGVISERVANGFYKRPEEFLWDVKTILKDRQTEGNEEAIKKAIDMYGSIRAEVLLVKSTYRDLMEACEAVYKRELQRKKELDEHNKEKDKSNGAADGFVFANVPRPAPESTVAEGPIRLGNLQSRPELPPPHTPIRPTSGPGSQGNGEARTNGVSNGDHAREAVGSNEAVAEVTMTSNGIVDLDTSSGSRPQFPAGYTVTPSNPTTTQHQSTQSGIPTQGTTTQPSQQSAIQRIAPGTQAEDYANDASTTDSAQRTTSQRTSDSAPRPVPFPGGSAGASNGNGIMKKRRRSDGEDDDAPLTTWASMVPPSDSQLPDTQSDLASKRTSTNNTDPGELWGRIQTQESPVTNGTQQHSQAAASAPAFVKPALPSHAATGGSNPDQHMAKKLRISQEEEDEDIDNSMEVEHLYMCDLVALVELHKKFVRESEGWTVDELEMFDGEAMNVVWETRENWNRDEVMKEVEGAFYECKEQVKVNREFDRMRQGV